MLPAGSCRNTVSPPLFHTAESALHQKRCPGLSDAAAGEQRDGGAGVENEVGERVAMRR